VNATFFSIIIPCYNQAHFITDAVQSILKQECQDFEVIIVDDVSTDDIVTVSKQWTETDSRIKLINKKNGGLSSARNAGLSVAKGEIIQFLDADDFLLDNCLFKVQTFFSSIPNADIVRVGYQYVGQSDLRIISTVYPAAANDYFQFIRKNNLGPCHSVFIKSAVAQRLGGFDEQLKSAEDWDFWIRAVKTDALILTLPEVLVAYRYVDDSMSRNAFRMYEALKKVSARVVKKDARLSEGYARNRDYDSDISDVLKYQLLRCLGVSVMQGLVQQSIDLFKREVRLEGLRFEAEEFSAMSSYLSFRYFLQRKEIDYLLKNVRPSFKDFFTGIGFTNAEVNAALRVVFERQLKKHNHHRFGKLLGAVLNRVSYYP
jgi:glycosyltransferase involved in cell wall biosynthesis